MSLRNTSLWTNELAIKWPWINSNEGWTANDPQLKYKFVRRRSSRSESEDMWSPDSSPQSKKGHDCDAFSGKLVPISRLLSECHHDNSDTNTSPFPPASAHISFHASHGREPAFCLPCVFPRPCDAGQRNAARMKERMGHDNFDVMLGPRAPCFDAAVVCDRRWACLQELKHFKTLKPGINSEHMELLHLGSDSTNACGWS